MIAHDAATLKALPLLDLLAALQQSVRSAAEQGLPAHQVELDIWRRVLAIGHAAFGLFLSLQGPGDLGPSLSLPDGHTVTRLEQTHPRDYRSVFGDFTIQRTCYGSREGQKIVFVPLDNRLQLPQSDYSYLLQQWDAALGSESAFARVALSMEDILGVKQPVDSLERHNRQMAESVEPFRESRPLPKAEEEGEVFVLSDDGKGVVMRKGPDDPQPKAHRNKGDKANKKRMAIVGAIYSVDRYVRTPEEVTAALFREQRQPGQKKDERPEPVGKHVWARLSRAADGSLKEPIDCVFGWQKEELGRRDPSGAKEVVSLMDGQEVLWEGKDRHFPGRVVGILDLMHVTPRLWQAAHLFNREGSEQARAFVRQRVLRVLKGQSKGVVMGLRRLGTMQGLVGEKKRKLKTICNYLEANEDRMRYDFYLEKGYPIASGVIEGACRHYVKDRMERSGMRWTKEGAQAMLDVRSEFLNGDWQAFHTFRIHRETQSLYPHRQLVEEVSWPLAA